MKILKLVSAHTGNDLADHSFGLADGIIGGILILLLIVIIYYLKKRKQKKGKKNDI